VSNTPDVIDARTVGDDVRFVAVEHGTDTTPSPWQPVKVPAAVIDAAIARLTEGTPGDGGRRAELVVHPESMGGSFAPGIAVSVEVLCPGERTTPVRRNDSLVQLNIRGSGQAQVGGTRIDMSRWDVCNIPSMQPHAFANTSDAVWVRLSYSNAPLLDFLTAHYAESVDAEALAIDESATAVGAEPESFTPPNAPDVEVSDTGARVRGYEFLVDIEPRKNRALHWPWSRVADQLSKELGDGGRNITAYYNPATDRRQGATHSFFVTAVNLPPGQKPAEEKPGHRHNSVAINYHAEGTGYSIVNGDRIDWNSGDLLLSAPSWSEHNHYVSASGATIFTVQDHPLHIGMESLIWQEDMNGSILALGTEKGQSGYVGPRQTG
jgi:gentisate 1,2-dioxygenase